jgi:hypothetical protein
MPDASSILIGDQLEAGTRAKQTHLLAGAHSAGEGSHPLIRYASIILLLLLTLIPAFLATQRSYFGYGTETDFLGNFVLEAERLLEGKALIVAFHPPLYPAVIALAGSMFDDWLPAALLVSVVAAGTGAWAAFWLVRHLLGSSVAIGMLVALLGSHVFLEAAAEATSDMLYFALYFACCALAVAGIQQGSASIWRLLGFALGAALLTRTNALPLLLLLAAPWLRDGPRVRRLEDCVRIAAAAALPLIAWFGYAIATGSPPLPTSNHLNLAMTYFAPGVDLISAEAFGTVIGRFDGIMDVLLRDPARLARAYLKDLLVLLTVDIPQLVAPPLRLLFLPGLILIVMLRGDDRRLWLLGLVFVAHIALLNFKAFEARYYLFVLPVLGAGAGVIVETVLRAGPDRRLFRWAAAVVLIGVSSATIVQSVRTSYTDVMSDRIELAEAVPAAQQLVEPGDVVVARKPHIAFYSGARLVVIANTTNPARLQEQLCAWSGEGEVHLFYGKVERERRPGLRAALLTDLPPPWLEVEAASERPGDWVLFRFRGCEPSTRPERRQLSIGPWTR